MNEETLVQSNESVDLRISESSQDEVRVSPLLGRRLVLTGLILMATVGAAAGIGVLGGIFPGQLMGGSLANESTGHEPVRESTNVVTTVKVVKPKHDASSEILFERIATIEPYYRADLRARASGLVKSVHFDIGDHVQQGEILIEIDVAESESDVAHKAALIVQREHELKVSEAQYKDVQAALGVTAATIRQKEAEVQAITATRDLKKRKVERYLELASRGSVTGSVVEEEERDLLASEAALLAAIANVDRAKADHEESGSKLEAAAADVELKKSQIEVARRERDRATVVANYGKVIAPFDGVVVRRNVDPGSFVQNATSGISQPLISLSRMDLLTVAAQFPDNAAPYIRAGTPAIIKISDIAGFTVSTEVTRISPSIQQSDRTMRVEIDLFNGNSDGLGRLERSSEKSESQRMLKVSIDELPVPAFRDDASTVRKLLPGMNASVQLMIGGGESAMVVPSSSVYSRSGTKYILLVEDGHTKQMPVQVHLNDGRQARISIQSHSGNAGEPELERLAELTGEELVVVANQLQVGDGADVQVAVADW